MEVPDYLSNASDQFPVQRKTNNSAALLPCGGGCDGAGDKGVSGWLFSFCSAEDAT